MSRVEAEILTRVISPGDPSLGWQVAEASLALRFKPADQQRMELLAGKAREVTLRTEERAEAGSFERVGHFVSPLKSKARPSLTTTCPFLLPSRCGRELVLQVHHEQQGALAHFPVAVLESGAESRTIGN